MSDLTAGSVSSGYDLAVHDNSTAHTGAKGHHDQVFRAASAAAPHLSEGRCIGVIGCLYRDSAQCAAKLSNDILVSPVQVDCHRNLAFFVDRSRKIDSNPSHIFLFDSFLFDLLQNCLCHVRKDLIPVILCPCGNLPLLQQRSVRLKKSAFNRCSAYINTKYIVLHLSYLSPSLFLTRFACTRLYSS